jgi:hypothetical protein
MVTSDANARAARTLFWLSAIGFELLSHKPSLEMLATRNCVITLALWLLT